MIKKFSQIWKEQQKKCKFQKDLSLMKLTGVSELGFDSLIMKGEENLVADFHSPQQCFTELLKVFSFLIFFKLV